MSNCNEFYKAFFVFIGLLFSVLFGYITIALLNLITKDIKVTAPEGIPPDKWDAVIKRKGTLAGKWLGILERIFFFIAIWLNVPELIIGWLAFKVGSKWEIWANVVKVPENIEIKKLDVIDFLRAKHAWGSRVLQRYLIGTLSNILGSFLCVYLVKLLMSYRVTP